jgi:hypothetical protein
MDGFAWFLIIFFGIGAIIPIVWSIIGLAQGNTMFWPGVFGSVWAVGLLLVTFIGIGTNWGGCPPGSATAGGSVQCYRRMTDTEPSCKPDLWKLQCNVTPRERCGTGATAAAIPVNAYCPTGQLTVFPFCEQIQKGPVKQPWATWSDLSFVAAGLWLFWFLSFSQASETTRSAGNPPTDNPMQMIGVLSVVYCMVVVFMGPPSQWYHASMKEWAGWFDSMSVVIWLTFNAVYVSYMLFATMWGNGRATERTILVMVIWLVIVGICGGIAINPDARTPLYFVGGVPWGLAELAYVICSYACNGVRYRRDWWWILINVLILGPTMIIWGFWNDSMAHTSCIGRAWFPGHALFHILASFSCVITFISFRSEKSV